MNQLLKSKMTITRSYSMREKLDEMFKECSSPDWDGFGAEPVEAHLRPAVLAFLDALPTQIPNPSISADPDGEVSVDWDYGPRQVFSVSIGDEGRLAYASIDGKKQVHGTEMIGDGSVETTHGIPQRLIDQIATFCKKRKGD